MQKVFENRERPAAAHVPTGFVLSERSAAHFLNTSPSTLRRDRATGHAGGIPFVRIGARVVYVREALECWLREQQQRPATRSALTATRGLKRGRPTKKEQLDAARLGLNVAQLRAREAAGAVREGGAK
ncbi:MAG: helix-turn-helix domain-containing protein [Pseudomonadota bacterium]